MTLTATRIRTLTQPDPRPARRSLLDQVARLEGELEEMLVSSWSRREPVRPVGSRGGPRVLSLAELERLRDDLAEQVHHARRRMAERTRVEEQHRCTIEAMLLAPEEHRWTRVSNADIGEPGCKHWHVRPRLGIIGMLAGWWHVKVSSGCPLAWGPWRMPRPRTKWLSPSG